MKKSLIWSSLATLDPISRRNIIGQGTAIRQDDALMTASGMGTDKFMEMASSFYTGGTGGLSRDL